MRYSRRVRPDCVAMIAVLAAILLGSGCRRNEAPASPAPPPNSLRIVSLSPAISRTLVDFELTSRIVGRTPWCESLDRAIPVVGDLYNLDLEAMVRLDPTHILVQPPAEGMDPALVKLADEHGWKLGTWHLDSIDHIEVMVRELPVVLYASDRQRLEESTSRASVILNDLAAALSPGGSPIYTGRTLIVTDYDPLMAFGPGSYPDDMLRAFGGRNASNDGAYRNLSLEDTVRLDPEAIIIIKAHAADDMDPISLLGPLAKTPIVAIQTGRVAILNHADAILPSTGLIEVAGALRDILVSFAATEP